MNIKMENINLELLIIKDFKDVQDFVKIKISQKFTSKSLHYENYVF